jgi:hypothetical protein
LPPALRSGSRRPAARQVSLTRSGRALITRIFDRHSSVLEAAADGLSRAERAKLIALLKKLGLSAQAKLADESGEGGVS